MFSWLRPGAPLSIIAHRGASARAPENTLAAFRLAAAERADAVELDVRLAADGSLVVIHDATLQRTTNGRGRVRSATLEEIRRLDAGGWFSAKYAGERVPTLEEVLAVVPSHMGINVELKADRGARGATELADRCCRLVAKSGRSDSVLITSFHHHLVAHAKRHFPHIPAGILLNPLRQSARSPVRIALAMRADYIVFGSRALTKRLTRKAHEEGLRVAEYTVNTYPRLLRAERYGVDAVITNHPAQMRRRPL